MELICIQGVTPGRVMATVSHDMRIRQIAIDIAKHPAGGWQAALPDGSFGPRCRGVAAAILMEAGEAFAPEPIPA